MRTRMIEWLDARIKVRGKGVYVKAEILYGVDVFAGGKWQHAHRNGKPLIFKSAAKAQAQRAILRKRPAPAEPDGLAGSA